MVGPGVVFGMKFLPGEMSTRLLQQGFYTALDKLTKVAPPQNIESSKGQVSVPPIPSQIVAIAPPVMAQRRSKVRINAETDLPECESLVSPDITNLLKTQLKRKCSE